MLNKSIIVCFLISCFTISQNSKADIVTRDAEIEEFLYELSLPLMEQEMVNQGILNAVTFKTAITTNQKPMPIYTAGLVASPSSAVPVHKTLTFGTAYPIFKAGVTTRARPASPIPKIKLFLVNNESLNAFATSGKKVFVFSGLFFAYDNANLLRGVLSHELSHIFAAHLVRAQIASSLASQEAALGSSILTLLTLASGGGGATAGLSGLFSAGAISTSLNLSYSRDYEKEADSKGLKNMSMLGYTARGLLDLMDDFKSQSYTEVPDLYRYFTTHPLPDERYSIVSRYVANEDRTTLITDYNMENKFQRVKAKLLGINRYKQKYTKISTLYSSIPPKLSPNVDFYDLYRQLFYNFSLLKYDTTIEIGLSLLNTSLDDPYISEVLGQSYCAMEDHENADKYFAITRNYVKNNPIIEYEYGECLVRFGKTDERVQKGVKILYASYLLHQDEDSLVHLMLSGCKKIENRGLRGLTALINARDANQTSSGKLKAIKILEEAISDPDFDNFEYKDQINTYYTELIS